MILYFDLDINRFITRPGFVDAVRRVEFKRGDAANVSLVFLRDNNIVELAPGAEIRFGIKEVGRYDDDAIVFFSDWQLVTLAYVGSPNFNTEGINALLFNDGDADNDVAFLDAMLEISYTEDGGLSWNSSDTVSARIHNDVIRGDEGVPLAGDPAYPSAQAFVDVVSASQTYASIALLEAVRPAANESEGVLSRVTDDPDFGYVEVLCVDLGEGLKWLPYPETLSDPQSYGWGLIPSRVLVSVSGSDFSDTVDFYPTELSGTRLLKVLKFYPLIEGYMRALATNTVDVTGSHDTYLMRCSGAGGVDALMIGGQIRPGAGTERQVVFFRLSHFDNGKMQLFLTLDEAVLSIFVQYVFNNFAR